MPTYTFLDVATGEKVGVRMSMHDAVPFGEEITLDGATLRRLPDVGTPPVVRPGVAHVSRVLPKHKLEDGSPATKGADGYTAEGMPIIESQATVDRIRKLNEGWDYGPDALGEAGEV